MLIDPITQDDWVVNGWKIYFSLHDKLLIQTDHQSVAKNGYEEEAVKNEWVDRVTRCLVSIRRYYTEFGHLPQAGDRLYAHDTGILIHERAIDGYSGEITFIITF